MSTTKRALSPILKQAKDIINLQATFLDLKALGRLTTTCKESQLLFGRTMLEREKAAMLLEHVLDADLKKVREFFISNPESLDEHSIVLTRSKSTEPVFKREVEPKRNRRVWKNISPLEAAAWCGDNFLVKELLIHVPETQYKEAANQLQGILDRKETAENGEYLAPFKALVKAYQNYFSQAPALHADGNHSGLLDLWEEVWQNQRMLPIYGIFEYLDTKPFYPLPSFNKDPDREWVNIGDFTLDLEACDDFSGSALFKSGMVSKGQNCHVFQGDTIMYVIRPDRRDADLKAIVHLCEVRTLELKNIIELLKPSHDEEVLFDCPRVTGDSCTQAWRLI